MGIAYRIFRGKVLSCRGEVTLVRGSNPSPQSSLIDIANNITRGKWTRLEAQVIAPEKMTPFYLTREGGGSILLEF